MAILDILIGINFPTMMTPTTFRKFTISEYPLMVGNFDFKLDQEKLRKVLLRCAPPMEQKLTFISIESRSIESMLLLSCNKWGFPVS